MSQVGKSAKEMGIIHPRDLKRLDPEPERPTPTKVHRQVKKPYGYAYDVQWFMRDKFSVRECWFETERARDQSMQDLLKKQRENPRSFYKDIRLLPTRGGASDGS